MIQVDEGDHQKRRGEGRVGKEAEAKAVLHKKSHGETASQRFNERIPPRDLGPAIPAFSPEEEIAHQGNVVIPTNGGSALRTKGAGRDNGKVLGQAVDAHIEEAPHTASDDKNTKEGESLNHDPPFSLSEPSIHPRPGVIRSSMGYCFHLEPLPVNIIWILGRCQFLSKK
jgi:hypothetical protein